MTKETPTPLIVKKYSQIIKIEDEQLLKRRQKLYGDSETSEQLKNTKFGIALSGGGIRSATINLGFLKTLNKFGIIKRADFLSTVSGGGYTGAYIQATLKNGGTYEGLFADEHIDYMRLRGEYLMPGMGWSKRWNILILIVGYLISLIMSWMSPLIVFGLIYIVYTSIDKLLSLEAGMMKFHDQLDGLGILYYSLVILGGLFSIHLIANLVLKYHVGVSRRFNQFESALVGVGMLWFTIFLITKIEVPAYFGGSSNYEFLIAALLLILAGFFTNPNALSFHRFYRNQLADAFLHFTGRYKNGKLSHFFKPDSLEESDYLAPYPLINTCLNLQSSNDKRFQGSKANDYFLLSPLYSGAKLTGYVSTAQAPDYKSMTLPAATTISAAAVNPGMGMYSNKLLSILMTISNARLGFWVANPLKLKARNIVWWPVYFFYELFSLIGTSNRKLNISDGGHIENLGVYELLRRNCRLIISVDAGADPKFSFSDLENLTIRARNELGLDIRFRENMIPENVIRPKPSHGYSEKRFAIADIVKIWEEIKPVDKNDQPILDKDGQKIEILINYKKVNDLLEKLRDEDQDELRLAFAKLNLHQNFTDVINALGVEENEKINEIVEGLTSSRKLGRIFKTLLSILIDVYKLLDKKLEKELADEEKRTEIFRQIINVIEERIINSLKVGTFVYVKSSVIAPEGKPQLGDRESLTYYTYKYKIYHPAFPHEPTSDQFFDNVQWESYFQLGQYIGAEVLKDDELFSFSSKPKKSFSIEALIDHFDYNISLFEEKPLQKTQPLGEIASRGITPEKMDTPEELQKETAAIEKEQATKDKKVVLGEDVKYKM